MVLDGGGNLKILLVGPNLPYGGITRYVKDLLFSSENYILFNTARQEKRKIRAGIGYRELFNAGFFRIFSGIFITILNMLRFPITLIKSDASVVHICGGSFLPFWENSWYMFISKAMSRKVILHYLGAFDQFYERAGPIQKKAIEVVMRTPDKLILLSGKVRKLVSSFVVDEKLILIPSSVDTNKFNSVNRRFPVSEGEIRILFVGGLDPFKKGIFDLLSSIEILIEQLPHLQLIMTGGNSFIEVEKVCKKKGLDRNVSFLGWIDEQELPSLYASVDILALPSYNEGLPYVIIEALSSGLPIVASDVGGIPEVITNKENGFIVSPGDVTSIASYIELLAEDNELRRKISQRNRTKAVQFYSIDAVLKNLNEIQKSLCNKSDT